MNVLLPHLIIVPNNPAYLKNLPVLQLFKKKIKDLLVIILILFPLQFTLDKCNAQEDSTAVETCDSSLIFVHSPLKASFYSAVLPGMGQIYNKKYWKLPIIYAGMGVLAYLINFNQSHYSDAKLAFIKLHNDDPNNMGSYQGYPLQDYNEDFLQSSIDFYRRNRDYSIMGLAVLYAANIIDATVDAYMMNYSINQDLSLHVAPTFNTTPGSNNFGICCTFRF